MYNLGEEGTVSIEGMITRVSELIPDLRIAVFRCSQCHHIEEVRRDGYRVENPERCRNCNTPGSMVIDHNSGYFVDKQLVKMQEVPDQVPEGETPQCVTLYAHEELFDAVKPGDKVVAVGGLHIVGTERHDSRRIDNQLRGRAGRQGDPGSSRFFLALDDDLIRLFGGIDIEGKFVDLLFFGSRGKRLADGTCRRAVPERELQARTVGRHFNAFIFFHDFILRTTSEENAGQ